MIDYTDFEFLEKLKEIYTFTIEVLDIAPDESLCSDEMKEVLADIQNLRESFYLIEDIIDSNIVPKKKARISLGTVTAEMCKELSQFEYTIEEYIELINKSGGRLKAAQSLAELSELLSREEIINDNWPALWDYPLEEKEYCLNEKFPWYWLKIMAKADILRFLKIVLHTYLIKFQKIRT